MEHMHETKRHGLTAFPYRIYQVRIPEDIRSYPLHWHEKMELLKGQGPITIGTLRSTRLHSCVVIGTSPDFH